MKEAKAVNHPAELWRSISESLGRHEDVVLATIIDRSGSGPREAGASMLILKDGGSLGTIGGGLLEARVLEMAGKVHRDRLPALERFFLTAKEAGAGGMICGGELEVLVDYLDPGDPSCRGIFDRLLKAQGEGRFVWLVRSLGWSGDGTVLKTGLGLIEDEGFAAGSLHHACQNEDRLKNERRREEAVMIDCGVVRCIIQPAGIHETVFIFGAGHIAQSLAPICTIAGFRIVVIDDRPEFAAFERFPMAAEVLVTEASPACFERLTIDGSGYVVIVTRGHAHDKTVLSSALKTRARYIGMIASRRKREIIFASLRDEGISENELVRVHSPIGLDIGARTPAEIAVSIVAELIAVRAGRIK
ncbi:MAG: XdhC family protein [Desulfuromonadales bacterium]|nr:XdhC family protein [Desulfuromonadales bacterium]